jgi:hypothetical protein
MFHVLGLYNQWIFNDVIEFYLEKTSTAPAKVTLPEPKEKMPTKRATKAVETLKGKGATRKKTSGKKH